MSWVCGYAGRIHTVKSQFVVMTRQLGIKRLCNRFLLALSSLWCILYFISLIQWVDIHAGISPRIVFMNINDGYLRMGLSTDLRYFPHATNGLDVSTCKAEVASFGFGTPHWANVENWSLAFISLPILWILALTVWLIGVIEWTRRRKQTISL